MKKFALAFAIISTTVMASDDDSFDPVSEQQVLCLNPRPTVPASGAAAAAAAPVAAVPGQQGDLEGVIRAAMYNSPFFENHMVEHQLGKILSRVSRGEVSFLRDILGDRLAERVMLIQTRHDHGSDRGGDPVLLQPTLAVPAEETAGEQIFDDASLQVHCSGRSSLNGSFAQEEVVADEGASSSVQPSAPAVELTKEECLQILRGLRDNPATENDVVGQMLEKLSHDTQCIFVKAIDDSGDEAFRLRSVFRNLVGKVTQLRKEKADS